MVSEGGSFIFCEKFRAEGRIFTVFCPDCITWEKQFPSLQPSFAASCGKTLSARFRMPFIWAMATP